MAEQVETEKGTRRGGVLPWIVACVLSVVAGAGGFLVASMGLLTASPQIATAEEATSSTKDEPTFLELDPTLIAVGGPGSVRQLRFRAFLQIDPKAGDAVAGQAPRILDICATYLRALDAATLQDPTALMRIRAQLLRRVQLLVGAEAVSDLLIIDFVIT
jgi:flagellar FliL protein